MGVRGLTTFIKNNEKKYLKNFKLHSCTVLMDGNSVASNLFIWSNIESAFGGDYDKFAKYVKEFFKIFQKCKIKPLVVFDGGYEQKKLRTVYSRLRDKFRSARCAQPQSGSLNFPLFMRQVFREVLVELNIPFAQSDFEADNELAALARQLQCPVLSYDSDFYIYDVLYIPLPTLSLEPAAVISKGGSDKDTSDYYLECKIYSVEVLIDSFGGLDKTMLPILAALLGNDYIKRSEFKKFYTNLKIPKGKTSPLQRRIKAVIEWLRNETFESAIEKILGRMKNASRRRVLRQLKKIIKGYEQCSSILSEYLSIVNVESSTFTSQEQLGERNTFLQCIDRIHENVGSIDEIEYPEDTCEDVDKNSDLSEDEGLTDSGPDDASDDDVTKENIFAMQEETYNNEEKNMHLAYETNFPTWLMDYARKGKIQSCVIDILSLNQYFFPPQVEDFNLSPSHFISLKFLNAIVGLLLGETETLVRYWTRNGFHLDWYTVEPIHETASLMFPPCSDILNISESKRKAAILEVAEVSVDLSVLPEEWHLFSIAIIFWLKNMKQPEVTECHLHTITMCLVAMFTVDKQIGVFRNKQFFMRKYKHFLNKLKQTRSEEKLLKENGNSTDSTKKDKGDTVDPKKDLENVSHKECVLIFGEILPYHHLSEQIKAKPKKFNISNVHAFAQFQSCLFHIIVLNSVMGFPFKEPIVSDLYSGTFVYNMFTNLAKRKNLDAYVETFFQSAPSLLALYKTIILYLEDSLTDIDFHKKSTKQGKKKKKGKIELQIDDAVCTDKKEEDEELFIDVNNPFTKLSLNV